MKGVAGAEIQIYLKKIVLYKVYVIWSSEKLHNFQTLATSLNFDHKSELESLFGINLPNVRQIRTKTNF